MKRFFAGVLFVGMLLSSTALAQLTYSLDFMDMELIDQYQEEDGSYAQAYLLDGLVTVYVGKVAYVEGETDTFESLLSAYYDAVDMETIEMEPIAAYPTYRARFIVGENEDTTRVDLIYVPTDSWAFILEIDTPVDWTEDYDETVESLIASFSIMDESELPQSDAPETTDEAAQAVA